MARSSLGYLRPYRGQLAWGVAMLVVTNGAFLGVPYFIGEAIRALQSGDHSHIATYVGWVIGFAVLTGISRIASRIWIFNAARAAEYDLRSDLFGHLMTLSPSYYRSHPTGDVMSRLTNDVQTVRAMWGAGMLNLANAIIAFATCMTIMVYSDPIVTLFAILPYPLIYWVGQALSRRIYRTQRDVQASLGSLSSRIQEDLGAIQVIKSYGLEDVRRRGFVDSSKKLLEQNMAAANVRIQLGPILNALVSLAVAILILVGGRAVIRGELDIGRFWSFSGYLARLVWPTLTLGFMLALVQRGRASWARLTDLQDTQPDLVDGTAAPLASSKAPASVKVDHLSIQIGDRTILDDISLQLSPGTVTAIVGRTGSGKSTLVDALCRLVVVPKGTVYLDGVDVTDLPVTSARSQIGYAPQEAFLFSTTIADNIAMGYGGGSAIPAARQKELERTIGAAASLDLSTEPKVIEPARSAGLERDLARMPEGLSTVVGERGITLSGGQRQRVALARALASMPRLLVLDDSLSSVDAETERLILANLRSVMHGRTAVLISHRVAAIKDADQIIVLDQGKIVARGTHPELLAAGGVYSDLYRSQLDTEIDKPRASQEIPVLS